MKTAETKATEVISAEELATAAKTTQLFTSQVQAQGVPITTDVMKMLAQLVAVSVREALRDPDKEKSDERKKNDRETVMREELQRIENKRLLQANCSHMDAYDHYVFAGQRNGLGQICFICLNCVRPFLPGDPEYAQYAKYVKYERLGIARQ